jgi:hypothetical protein
VMMMAETMMMFMIVVMTMGVDMGLIVRVFHSPRSYGFLLTVIVSRRCKKVDHPDIGPGDGGVRHIGGYDMYHARREQKGFTADHHLQLPLDEIRRLLLHMPMLDQGTALPDLPEGDRTTLSMNHLSKKTWPDLPGRDIVEVLHEVFFRMYGICRCGKVDKLLSSD